ncbi:hypothetical protein [Sutcliffiella horikoshii]|uniref:hypothetical protein n=1 Tax=Sutcliffiella horikoshii TaxID=79883 RepID=UPI0012FB4A78|nr:hypothetical protein [Sutcliffiella horikoshii]
MKTSVKPETRERSLQEANEDFSEAGNEGEKSSRSGMKTPVKPETSKRSLHGANEDISEAENEGEKSSWSV